MSIVTAAAYSTSGVTTAAIAEAVAADVTVATVASANLSTAEAAAADLPVPVNTAASSSAGMAIAEAAATDVATILRWPVTKSKYFIGKTVHNQSFFRNNCVWTALVFPLSVHSTMWTILISEQSFYDLTYLITAPNKLYYLF